MHRNILLLARGLTIATLALCLGGCGKRQYDVTGVVKYNGAPLAKPDGQIVFIGPDGSQVSAAIGQDGTYKAIKVTAGMNQVAVYYPNPAYQDATKRSRPPKGVPPPSTLQATPPPFLTPTSYASGDTSNLSIQVEPGTVFNVEMAGPDIK